MMQGPGKELIFLYSICVENVFFLDQALLFTQPWLSPVSTLLVSPFIFLTMFTLRLLMLVRMILCLNLLVTPVSPVPAPASPQPLRLQCPGIQRSALMMCRG